MANYSENCYNVLLVAMYQKLAISSNSLVSYVAVHQLMASDG